MPCRATRAQEQHRIGSLSLSGSAMRWSCGRRARRSTRSPRHLATRSGAAHPKPSAARWRRRFSTRPTELRALEVERLDALWAVPPRTVAGAAILLALPRAPASAGRSRRLPHRALPPDRIRDETETSRSMAPINLSSVWSMSSITEPRISSPPTSPVLLFAQSDAGPRRVRSRRRPHAIGIASTLVVPAMIGE